jgi:hypothetical protein
VLKGVAHHIRLRVPKSAAHQLGLKKTADDSLSGSSSFDGGGSRGHRPRRWRTISGTRSVLPTTVKMFCHINPEIQLLAKNNILFQRFTTQNGRRKMKESVIGENN